MKFIYVTIFRHGDRTVLLRCANNNASSKLKAECIEQFMQISKTFRKTALYENMREINEEFNE